MAKQKIFLLAHFKELSDFYSGMINSNYVGQFTFMELQVLLEKEINDHTLLKYIDYWEIIQKRIDYHIYEMKKDIQKIKTEINYNYLLTIAKNNSKKGK